MIALLFAALFAVSFTLLFQRRDYFQLQYGAVYPLKFWQTAGAFLIYVGVAFLAVPVSRLAPRFALSSWFQVVYLVVTFIALWLYLLVLNRQAVHAIFWGESRGEFPDFKRGVVLGAMTWFLAYPYVLFVNASIKFALGESDKEQIAVQFLKKMKGKPLLLSAMLVLVVFVVPFMEELLFRGFLQTWLRRRLSRFWGIAVTAFIFALVHFAPGQNNLEIIPSLFVLSLFLGYVYEKTRLLWAPLALHATFNAVSSLVVLLSK